MLLNVITGAPAGGVMVDTCAADLQPFIPTANTLYVPPAFTLRVLVVAPIVPVLDDQL